MTIIAQDTFNRANQSGWGTASDGETWAQVAGTAATFAIASNEGTFTGVTGSTVELLGSKTLADCNALVRFSVPATADSISLIARSDAAGANGYLARYTSGNITLCTFIASVVGVVSTTPFTLAINTFYWLRLKVVGSTITVSIWQDGNPESSATVLTTTNTTFTAAGQFGFRISMAATGDVAKLDNFSVDDLLVAVSGYPPRYIPRAFGGTIVPDPVTQPLAYIQRALGGTIVYEARTFIPRALGGVYIPDTVMWVPRALVGTEQVSLLRSLTLAGVGTLSPTLSAALPLPTETIAGVGTLVVTLALSTALTTTMAGAGTLTGTLSTSLATTFVGVGILSATLTSSLSAAVSQPLPYIGRAFGSTIVYENRTFIPRALGSTYIPDTLLPVPRALLSTIQTPHVVRSGSQLFLNGVAFRFSGANVYWLGLKNLAYPTTSEIDDALQTVVEMGGTVVRSHTLGVSTGNSFSIQPFGVTYPTAAPFNDTAFNTIDYAIYRAGQLGLKLIIPLTDDYHDYEGGKHDFTDYRGVVEANFYTDSGVLSDFEAYISHVLNRINQYSGVAYKNDTTIMAWETGNELSTATATWTDTIAQYIKSIDAIHLVYNGKTMHASNSDGTTAIFTLASIDILTDHFYPPNNANLTTWSHQAQSSGKVYDVGEYDWTDTAGDTLSSFLSTIEASNAISGDHPWSLFAHNAVHGFIGETSGDPYALWYPGQTTALRAAQTKLRNHAFTIAGLSIPASSTPAAPDGVAVTVNQVTWHGVVAANTYDVERSTTSGTGPFSVIGTGLTDLDTPWTDTDTTPSTRYYRTRAYNIDGVAGAYSSIVTASYLGVTIVGAGTLTSTLTGGAHSTLTTGLRTPVRTQVTRSLGLRVRTRTQKALSTVLRTVVQTARSLAVGLRTAVRTQATRSSVLRAVIRGVTRIASLRVPVRTQRALTVVVRTLVRTLVSESSQLRARVRTQRALSTVLRVVTTFTGTLLTKSTVVRLVARTLRSVSTGVRTLVRSQVTRVASLRAVIRGITRLSNLRVVVRGRSMLTSIRAIVRGITRVARVRVPVRSQKSVVTAIRTRAVAVRVLNLFLLVPVRSVHTPSASIRVLVYVLPPVPNATLLVREGAAEMTMRAGDADMRIRSGEAEMVMRSGQATLYVRSGEATIEVREQ